MLNILHRISTLDATTTFRFGPKSHGKQADMMDLKKCASRMKERLFLIAALLVGKKQPGKG